MLFFVLLPLLWRDFFPRLVLFLLDSIRRVLFILGFLTLLLFVLVSLCSNCCKLGQELELPFELVDGGSHCDGFVVVEGLSSPHALVALVIEL